MIQYFYDCEFGDIHRFNYKDINFEMLKWVSGNVSSDANSSSRESGCGWFGYMDGDGRSFLGGIF